MRIIGPGIGLPFPSGVLPEIRGFGVAPTNRIELQGGQMLRIPAGYWIIDVQGIATEVQFLDPVTEEWVSLLIRNVPPPLGWVQLLADGFNYRVYNTAQVGLGADVTAPGSGYQQATTTVTPSTGNSIWRPVIGGALGNPVVINHGSGFTIPPIAYVPAPPPPGRTARAIATLAADGTVASVTIVNPGAGYKQPPPITISPSLNDPNIDEIKGGVATTELVGAGTLTAVLLANFGAPLSAPPTLTISGSGTGAAATVVPGLVGWTATNELIGLQPAGGG